jgi:hypothetical protein
MLYAIPFFKALHMHNALQYEYRNVANLLIFLLCKLSTTVMSTSGLPLRDFFSDWTNYLITNCSFIHSFIKTLLYLLQYDTIECRLYTKKKKHKVIWKGCLRHFQIHQRLLKFATTTKRIVVNNLRLIFRYRVSLLAHF